MLGRVAKRACAVPNLGGPFFRRGGNSSGTEGQQDGQEQESFHGRVPPIAYCTAGIGGVEAPRSSKFDELRKVGIKVAFQQDSDFRLALEVRLIKVVEFALERSIHVLGDFFFFAIGVLFAAHCTTRRPYVCPQRKNVVHSDCTADRTVRGPGSALNKSQNRCINTGCGA